MSGRREVEARSPGTSVLPRAVEHAETVPAMSPTTELSRDVEVPDDQLTTTLATLTYRAPARGARWPRHFLEAVAFCVMGLAFGHAVGDAHAGVVSLFLASAALSSRFKQVVRRHRRASATRLVLAIAPLGVGAFVAYSLVCAWLGPDGVRERFAFAVSATGVGVEGLSADRFRSSWGLLGHNLLVVVSAFLLAFVYRGFGALLTLMWNAAAWAAALVLLARPEQPVGVAMLAVGPHLALEALAFICAALAGVGVGTQLAGNRGLRAAGRLAGVAVLAILLGWLVEGSWPRWILAG
jgi:hypothetical protein